MSKRAAWAVLLMAAWVSGLAMNACAQGAGVATAQGGTAGSFDKLRTGSSTAVGAAAPTSAQDDKGNGGAEMRAQPPPSQQASADAGRED
jgi:hypothetical protein